MAYDLERFLAAQEREYQTALSEIKSGRKRSHWIWYIFPQIQGLGYSSIARYYAIQDTGEAQAYIQHPVLGKRLIEISNVLLTLTVSDPTKVMGHPDDLKLRSSMTLFSVAAPEETVFKQVLDKFYDGKTDKRTLEILQN